MSDQAPSAQIDPENLDPAALNELVDGLDAETLNSLVQGLDTEAINMLVERADPETAKKLIRKVDPGTFDLSSIDPSGDRLRRSSTRRWSPWSSARRLRPSSPRRWAGRFATSSSARSSGACPSA